MLFRGYSLILQNFDVGVGFARLDRKTGESYTYNDNEIDTEYKNFKKYYKSTYKIKINSYN